MKKNLICVACPLGCPIEVEIENGEVVSVTGNTCKRGDSYARTEITNIVLDGSRYRAYTDGLFVTGFDTIYTIELEVDGVVTQTIKYSVNYYCAKMQNHAQIGELARATYNYGVAAEAYR